MKATLCLVVALIALLSAGCIPIPSVGPLYVADDVGFEPLLLGTWQDVGDKSTWKFSEGEHGAYNLTVRPSPSTSVEGLSDLVARLVTLEDHLFMDLTQGKVSGNGPLAHIIPVHTFWRVWLKGDVLLLSPMDTTWFANLDRAGQVTIQHVYIEDLPLLTASTGELRRFVSASADDPKAFPIPIPGQPGVYYFDRPFFVGLRRVK